MRWGRYVCTELFRGSSRSPGQAMTKSRDSAGMQRLSLLFKRVERTTGRHMCRLWNEVREAV